MDENGNQDLSNADVKLFGNDNDYPIKRHIPFVLNKTTNKPINKHRIFYKVNKMRCELPEFARCCFCFPLRLGLLAWAYTKLGCSLLACLYLTGIITSEISFIVSHHTPINFVLIYSLIMVTMMLIDIGFLVYFVVGAHKKDPKKMKIFYIESLCALVFYIMFFIGLTISIFITFSIFAVLFISIIWAFSFWTIIVQAYISILVRSEVVKLERQVNFQFINPSTEPEQDESVKVDVKLDY